MNAIGGRAGQALAPTLWQQAVMMIPEGINIAMLGGRAPGKTTGSLFVALRHVVKYGAAAKVLLIRKTNASLREIEARLVVMFMSYIPGTTYNGSHHILACGNGATVELGHLEHDTDFQRYQGREATLLIVDEITLWSSLHTINLLRSNLRSASGVPVATILCGNPGGPGHAIVSARYLAGRTPWVPYEVEPGEWWVTATGTVDDNPHIDPIAYEVALRSSTGGDEALFNAWRHNSWDAIGGAFFQSQWGPHLYARDLPGETWRADREGWASFWSLDWGISSPAVAMGYAEARERGLRGPGDVVVPQGSRIVLCSVDSHDPADMNRGLSWSVDQLAEEVLRAGEEFGIEPTGCVDDARGLGADETVAKELARCGLSVQPARKVGRAGSGMRLKTMMAAAKKRDPDAPWWLIHERCRYAIETMSSLPRSPRLIDDCDTKANDHAYDAARYGTDYAIPEPQVWGLAQLIPIDR